MFSSCKLGARMVTSFQASHGYVHVIDFIIIFLGRIHCAGLCLPTEARKSCAAAASGKGRYQYSNRSEYCPQFYLH